MILAGGAESGSGVGVGEGVGVGVDGAYGPTVGESLHSLQP